MRLDKIKEKLETWWIGYHVDRFKVSHIRHNLLLLLQMNPKDFAASDSTGKLFKKSYSSFCFANALRLNGLNRRTLKAIKSTFITFCYEIRTPIELGKMHLIHMKKKNILNRVLKNLESMPKRGFSIDSLKNELEQFERRFYIQVKVIKAVDKALKKHQPPHCLMKEVTKALTLGIKPILTIRGFSGTYFMRDTHYRRVGVFKPFDEEIGAPNNPSTVKFRGVLGSRFSREGVRTGECLHREVAAYVVDRFIGLDVVPQTFYAAFFSRFFVGARKSMLQLSKEGESKKGSFQVYIEGCESLGKSNKEALAQIPPDLLQPLYILDLVIGHLDRHLHNILFDGKKIIAIDNGLSFPDRCESLDVLEWKKLPQAQVRFSQEFVEKIEGINWALLKNELERKSCLSSDSIQRVETRLALLKTGVEKQMTPAEIVDLMCGENLLSLFQCNQNIDQLMRKK